ncbi:TlpA disulfide reductase family protein [Haloferula chungangensis]|uniref:TlpA disulfide reductase family protein n=1 Tax=Haloferula chungangensis TaxID=1048331 RepID=A0ABW2L516_9BACT
MKSITATFFALLLALPVHALSPGDQVTPDAIAKADFIKGEPIKTWEPGKPYIITCWASGSTASVATLPMLQDLQNIYGKRGLRIIAINVGENDREKVVAYMENQGKRITHSVAFVPSGDTFQTEWVDAAQVTKLPFAFVVRDGRYIYGAHPAKLNGELIDAFLAGGQQQQDALDKVEREKVTEGIIGDQLKAYSTAQAAQDADAMERAIASIATTQPDFVHIPRMIVDVALVRKDWSSAIASLKGIDNPQLALMSAALISRRYDTSEEQPAPEVYEAVAEILAANMADDASVKASLARVQWKLGKKEEALATAHLAALKPGDHPKAPFDDFAKSFESDSPQSLEDLITALQEAVKPKP